ncbi:VOC family protein [Clostridium sp.]|uniref:VOC family protein n=1 Tax=Clostridium sp. TaxID=1506 RepID=UPI002FCBF0F9
MSLQLVPYILMNSRAKEAIEYYKDTLKATVLFQQTFGEGPKDEMSNIKKDELDLIAHAVLKIGENKIMIADTIPELPFQAGNQVSICITTSDIVQAKELYEGLKKEGKVLIELNEIYFSPGYGMVTDKFGVTFQIYTNRQ